MVGKYAVIAKIGSGGMGEVFLALDRTRGRRDSLVVLKTLHEHLAVQPAYLEMMKEEVRIARHIRHPNTVSVREFETRGNTHFIVMEYLEGQTLSAVIEQCAGQSPMDIASRCRVIADCAAGLHAAHVARTVAGLPLGVVHRDVSPHNIIVMHSGHVKVVDFGLAKARGRAVQTEQSILKGKIGYVSPEQIRCAPVDGRSDVFALGIVLWELLTARRLFTGDSAEGVLRTILDVPAKAPSSVNPAVPFGLDTICLRALERDPKLRYPTAQDMQRALETFLCENSSGGEASRISAYMTRVFGEALAGRRRVIAEACAVPNNGASRFRTARCLGERPKRRLGFRSGRSVVAAMLALFVAAFVCGAAVAGLENSGEELAASNEPVVEFDQLKSERVVPRGRVPLPTKYAERTR